MADPDNLKYATSHEWAKLEKNGDVTVGITEHAQDQLGDVVFVQLPVLEQDLKAQQACMLIESVKSASDIYMPVDGKIIAVNSALEDDPELINQSPYDEGWLFRLTPENQQQLAGLLSLKDYNASLDD